jgi:hypothetical protein
MELDSVYELREKVRQRANRFGFSLLGPLLDVSIGVALTKDSPGQFRLALRLRSSGLLHWRFRTIVEGMAKGEIDVATTGPVRVIGGCPAHAPRNRAPLGIGASIGNAGGSGGTVGFFAKRRSDQRIGVVSNNHVIALEDQAADDSEVIHPSRCDGGDSSNLVARLDGSYPSLGGGGVKRVDCAFAALEPGVRANRSSLRSRGTLRSTTALARNSDRVFKIGRTTGERSGRVRAFDFDNVVVRNFHFGDVTFENQIEIESASRRRDFSDAGDSGSLIFNEDQAPVGLLFAETSIDGTNDLGLHYANPIDAVLEALQVDIAV